MYCSNCGHKNEENTNFCAECGNRLEAAEEVSEPKKVYCSACDSEAEAGSKFCEKCGASLEEKSNKKSGGKFKAAIIAAVAIIVLACATAFGYNIMSNPMLKIRNAVKNTLGAQSAEFEMITDAGYGETYVSGEIELDIDDEYLFIHLDIEDDEEGWILYDDSEVTLYLKERGRIEEEDASEEMGETFEMLFAALNGKTDDRALRRYIKDSELGDYIDIDKLEKSGEKFVKKLVTGENLENVLGYEKKKDGSETVYSFEPDFYEFLLFVIDNCDDLFDADVTDEIKQAKKYMKDVDDDYFPYFKIDLTVSGKYLVGFEMETDDLEMEIRLSNVNNATVDFPDR